MNTLEVLRETRKLLAGPDGWTQGAYARPEPLHGSVNIFNKRAHCFCLAGALYRAINVTPGENYGNEYALIGYARALGFQDENDVVAWNDNLDRTHAEVLERLDTAIAKLEAGE
jgi:hypothetical protein